MRKKLFEKSISILTVLCLTAGLLAGCGGSASGAGKSASSGAGETGTVSKAESSGGSQAGFPYAFHPFLDFHGRFI